MVQMLAKHKKYRKVETNPEPTDLFDVDHLLNKRFFTPACLWASFSTSVLIAIYFAPSIGLTFYQRWLYMSFKFPLITVLVHMLVKLILAALIRILIGLKFKNKSRLNLSWREYFIAIAPAGIFSGIDIGFSNWGLELIRISLYTMTKSTSILFILAFGILFKLEKKSWSSFIIVLMIAFGLTLVTYKAEEFNLLGFILVLIASMSSGLRWTCVQILMQKSKIGMKSPIDMIYHMQGFMFVSVLPFMLIIEGPTLIEYCKSAFDTHEFSIVVGKILLGAFIAFLMEFTEVLVVSHTSSLTLSIAGIFKELIMLLLAVMAGDTFSTINIIGLVFCMAGIIIHVIHKITLIQTETRHYEFDASDASYYDVALNKPLLDEQEIDQMHLSSASDDDQNSQEIFNILNRHDR